MPGEDGAGQVVDALVVAVAQRALSIGLGVVFAILCDGRG